MVRKKRIVIFDQAESFGGSVYRAIDLTEEIQEFDFIFLGFLPRLEVDRLIKSNNLKYRQLRQFSRSALARHLKRITSSISFVNNLLDKLIFKLDRFFLVIQALYFCYFKSVKVVQANSDIQQIPMQISKILRSKLVIYFRSYNKFSETLVREALKHSSKFIFVSETLKLEYSKAIQFPEPKCFVIHSPISNNNASGLFSNNLKGLIEDIDYYHDLGYKVVVQIARINPVKGQLIALKALRRVLEIEKNVVFFIVGAVDPDEKSLLYKKILDNFITENCLSENVFFYGHQDSAKSILFKADISVNPANYFEGMGGAVLESMMAGTPTIASKTGGHLETIKHEENGFLHEVDDYIELSVIIINILNKKFDLNSISDKAVTSARLYSDKIQIVNKVRELYNSLL